MIGAGANPATCSWRQLSHSLFDSLPPGAVLRNGQFGRQATVRRDGRGVFLQGSDWSQLFIPIGPGLPDTFAVGAEFWLPAEGRYASLHVFIDPSGPLDSSSSNVVHGRGLGLLQAIGHQPSVDWGTPAGTQTHSITYQSALATAGGEAFIARWHSLRIEGSRSGCWIRAALDGVFLLTEVDHCDFDGKYLLLAGSGESYVAADVAWRNVSLHAGEGNCR